ncbi:MAG: 50S ribosomal protein L29 [Nitrososphaerota archaeon]|nr:50S ribosomal protein L29 [Nitrososphaerota archaeon]MDG6966731.1 50S ribosomal protein L29 [Nitrososphaerota archaeon]MDG6979208.1 50S ribosomal protein L29 [Nitrososphaerota archaeon]MDG7022334.1 50S ribosomal protein L29 [Nitrososphaerota archaeon]
MKASELRKQEADQLKDRLFELRGELARLRSLTARGMIQKQSGSVSRVKKDVARILTVLKEKGQVE